MPKTILAAKGIKICACELVSNNNGVIPTIVVIDVSSTALKRS